MSLSIQIILDGNSQTVGCFPIFPLDAAAQNLHDVRALGIQAGKPFGTENALLPGQRHVIGGQLTD